MAKILLDEYPAISDLERRSSRRIPHFAWEYLDQGTGADQARDCNIESLSQVQFLPQFFKGQLDPRLTTELLGVEYAAPIGIAPVGMAGLIWPGADLALAKAAATYQIPYTMSTFGNEKPEVAGPLANGMGWFQLFPARDPDILADLLQRVSDSGFTTLVVTVDVPVGSRRERQTKAGVRFPPVIGPRLMLQSAIHPAWVFELLRKRTPRFRTIEKYGTDNSLRASAEVAQNKFGGPFSFEDLAQVREIWDGPLVVKGIMDPNDAQGCLDQGVDAIQVSNHGGRQLDGAPGALDALPAIVDRVGDSVPVLFDSGIRSGLDVARALALGASFVFCGRPFIYGLGALGVKGPGHAFEILRDDLLNVMSNAGCEHISELSDRLIR